jgi:polyisoprenoid-binding protein YceI
MATLGSGDGYIRVRAKREGMAARVGHDLTLQAGRWSAEVTLDPGDITRSNVTATIDARSLEVIEATGGVVPLSEKDRVDIRKNMEKVLQADRYPEITFRSTAVEASDGRLTVTGDLSMVGTTRPVRLDLTREAGTDSDHLSGRVTIRQTEWGIRPYSGLLGALKIADPVDVELDLRVPHG